MRCHQRVWNNRVCAFCSRDESRKRFFCNCFQNNYSAPLNGQHFHCTLFEYGWLVFARHFFSETYFGNKHSGILLSKCPMPHTLTAKLWNAAVSYLWRKISVNLYYKHLVKHEKVEMDDRWCCGENTSSSTLKNPKVPEKFGPIKPARTFIWEGSKNSTAPNTNPLCRCLEKTLIKKSRRNTEKITCENSDPWVQTKTLKTLINFCNRINPYILFKKQQLYFNNATYTASGPEKLILQLFTITH